MQNLRTPLLAIAILSAIAALAPAPADAAPPRCSCEYCDENPDQWCSFIGYTNTCNLFLSLWCDGGFPLAPAGSDSADTLLAAADLCPVSSEEAPATDSIEKDGAKTEGITPVATTLEVSDSTVKDS